MYARCVHGHVEGLSDVFDRFGWHRDVLRRPAWAVASHLGHPPPPRLQLTQDMEHNIAAAGAISQVCLYRLNTYS